MRRGQVILTCSLIHLGHSRHQARGTRLYFWPGRLLQLRFRSSGALGFPWGSSQASARCSTLQKPVRVPSARGHYGNTKRPFQGRGAGSVRGAHNSRSPHREFEPHLACRDYFNKQICKNKIKLNAISKKIILTFPQVRKKFLHGVFSILNKS